MYSLFAGTLNKVANGVLRDVYRGALYFPDITKVYTHVSVILSTFLRKVRVFFFADCHEAQE